MRLTCPECGAVGSIAQFTADADARAVGERLAALAPDLGIPVMRYMGLFRPNQRGLTWPRARRLLEDLAEMMGSPAIQRGGKDWPVTREMWRQALEHMADKRSTLTLPLQSHGYLLTIVAGLAGKAQTSAEDKHEAELRAGLKRGADAPARQTRQSRIDTAVAAENAARKRLKLAPLKDEEIPAFLHKEGLQ